MMRLGCMSVLLTLWAGVCRAQEASDTDADFATFGVKITPPASWKRFSEDGANLIAKWAVGQGNALRITVELEDSKGRSAKNFANVLAQQSGAKVTMETAGLADEPTVRITFRPPAGGDAPD